MDFKALGGTPFRPGALSLVKPFTAYVNSFQEVGMYSSYITSHESMSFITLLLILFLLFNTFPKCFTKTLTLSSSASERSPEGRLI